MAVAGDVPLVLVTGASGFIATHIVQQLLVKGKVKVRGTVRSLKNEEKVKPLQEMVPDATYPLELVEADLMNEESWKEAVRGCSYVYHVASPVPLVMPKYDSDVVAPAVEGTLNVLKACADSGTVKRVVLTSSVAAIEDIRSEISYVFTENDWGDDNDVSLHAYAKSKICAERAAWTFVERLDVDQKFELVAINPVFVLGPLVKSGTGISASIKIIENLLNRNYSFLVEMSLNVVDVRDVATAHIIAMEMRNAAGNRYILNNQALWLKEIAAIVTEEFQPQGYSIPQWSMPMAGAWILWYFSGVMRRIYLKLGRVLHFSNEKMRTELGIEPRDIRSTILDTCYSIIENGIVPKMDNYRGPPTPLVTGEESVFNEHEVKGVEESNLKILTSDIETIKEDN